MRNSDGGWDASLALRFARRGARTALVANCHHGPARVQRPFYPEGPECVHAYLLHPPGGYVGGDSQVLDVRCERDAAVLLTTPAATKFYKTLGPCVRQRMAFTLAAGARLEWLPMEAIVFHEARVRSILRIDLGAGASFAGWDIVCLGRPASHEPFVSGVFDQHFSVWREGLPLWVEHAVYEGGSAVLRQKYGLGGACVCATFVCTKMGEFDATALRALCGDGPEPLSFSENGDILVARYLGESAQRAREALTRVWHIVRRAHFGVGACEPRIWQT